MQIDAFDDVVAVEKRSPGQAQQVCQPGVDEDVVDRLCILHFVEDCAETTNPAGVETPRELPDGILLQQRAGVPSCRDLSDKRGPEYRPPELVVAGFVDQGVILTGKEPGQCAGCEGIAPLAQQVGGSAAEDQVDLEFGMAMGAGSNLAGPVPHDASMESSADSEVIDHRKKR